MSLDLSHLDALLVEPSPTQQRIIRELVATAGLLRVREAGSMSEALAQMREKAPDVVISALYLPDADGTDLNRPVFQGGRLV